MSSRGRRSLRARLDIDLGASPIEGVLTDDDGRETRFTGWLGLAAALEDLQHAATREVEQSDV
jgi:hypothetical protein